MKKTVTALLLLFFLPVRIPSVLAQQKPVKNIILLQGVYVDGSGWKPVGDLSGNAAATPELHALYISQHFNLYIHENNL